MVPNIAPSGKEAGVGGRVGSGTQMVFRWAILCAGFLSLLE